jgi:hypothetical protein
MHKLNHEQPAVVANKQTPLKITQESCRFAKIDRFVHMTANVMANEPEMQRNGDGCRAVGGRHEGKVVAGL